MEVYNRNGYYSAHALVGDFVAPCPSIHVIPHVMNTQDYPDSSGRNEGVTNPVQAYFDYIVCLNSNLSSR